MVEHRYLADERFAGIESLFTISLFPFPPKLAQQLFHVIAFPFLYPGNTSADVPLANLLYEKFFDVPIQKAEKDTIRHALLSNWDFASRDAGLLDQNEKKVWLQSQVYRIIHNKMVRVSQSQKRMECMMLSSMKFF